MKKHLIPVLVTLAVAFSLSSCGGGSPVTELLDKCDPFIELGLKYGDSDDLEDELSTKQMMKYASMAIELADFAQTNKKYKLTDKDKDAVCDWALDFYKKLAKSEGEKLDKEDLKDYEEAMRDELEDIDTLGELVSELELDDLWSDFD